MSPTCTHQLRQLSTARDDHQAQGLRAHIVEFFCGATGGEMEKWSRDAHAHSLYEQNTELSVR